MRLANTQVLNQNMPLPDQMTVLQTQLNKMFTCVQGRVSFGTGVDGVDGMNIEGQWQTYTSSVTPDFEDTIGHTIGSVPLGYIVISQDKAGSAYKSSTGTAWTSTNIYLKCSVASVTFLLFLLKKGSVTS